MINFLRPRMSIADWQVLIGVVLAGTLIIIAAFTWMDRLEASTEPNAQIVVLNRIDCSAFPDREAALTFNKILGHDVFGLDGDNDGIPCEGLTVR